MPGEILIYGNCLLQSKYLKYKLISSYIHFVTFLTILVLFFSDVNTNLSI